MTNSLANSALSKQARKCSAYWLCECGVARTSAESMHKHLDNQNHYAERIDVETGAVTGFMAGGLNHQKYGTQVPGTAQLNREANKNDPLFKR